MTSTEFETQTEVNDTVEYSINTEFATEDNVIIEQKNSSTGTYEKVATPNAAG